MAMICSLAPTNHRHTFSRPWLLVVGMKSILVVENDLALRHTLFLILCRAGYLVETSTDLRSALALLSPQLYDLLLIDFHSADFDLSDWFVEIRQRDS